MNARKALAEKIRPDLPAAYRVIDYPDALRMLDHRTPAAIVIEGTSIATGDTSPDGARIPIVWTLSLWVVVDGSRGDLPADTEDRLDEALEATIRALVKLPAHLWDGTAERTQYDTQKPAYRLTITAHGHITEE